MSEQVFRIVLTMDGVQGPAQAFRQTAQAMQQTAAATQQVQRAARPAAGSKVADPANVTRDLRDTGRTFGPSPAIISRIQHRELRAHQQQVFAEMREMQRTERAQRSLAHMSAVQAIRVEERERRQQERDVRRNQIVGPHARIRQAQAMLARAGTPEEVQDAQLILARRQFALLRAQRRGAGGGGVLGQIGEAVMSARVGVGPGGLSVMPLVGRVFDIIRTANPVLGAWVLGIVAVTAASIEAAKSIRVMAAAAVQSGGTFGQATMLARLGLPAGQIAGAAAGLRERLSTDPYAMMAGARLGIGPQPPPQFGSQNFAKTLIQALEQLRRVTDAEEQLRLARMLQIEGLLDLARVSEDVWQGIKTDAATAQRAITPQNAQSSRDLMTGLGRIGGNLMTLLETITAPLVTILAPVANIAATAIDFLINAVKGVLAPLNFVTDALGAAFGAINNFINALNSAAAKADKDAAEREKQGGFAGAYIGYARGAAANPFSPIGGLIGGIQGAIEGWRGGKSATDANTDAVNANTRIMREGYFGGGPRTRGALPSGMGGEALKKALEGGALRYGAWQLGAG